MKQAAYHFPRFSIPAFYKLTSVPIVPQQRWLSHAAARTALWNAYHPDIPPHTCACLTTLEAIWHRTQPLAGKKILINVHLTLITLAMVRILLSAGATVDVTLSPELAKHDNALHALQAAAIPFLSSIPNHQHAGYYDIIYNCGGGDRRLVPRLGEVELTHTPAASYLHTPFPVITVNRSKTKAIETEWGTGDSVVRVINTLVRQAIQAVVAAWQSNPVTDLAYLTLMLSMLDMPRLFAQNRWMIFGYGKVGQGIAHALESAGASKKNIYIVEIDSEKQANAYQHGYQSLRLAPASVCPDALPKIRRLMPTLQAVITATGVEATLSHYFNQADFHPATWLINMGTRDEFGARFAPERIVNHKKPANFMLDFPTDVRYLDPILSLFLQAGAALVQKSFPPGLQGVSPALDQAVLTERRRHHRQADWPHRTETAATQRFIQTLRGHAMTESGLFARPRPQPASNKSLQPLTH